MGARVARVASADRKIHRKAHGESIENILYEVYNNKSIFLTGTDTFPPFAEAILINHLAEPLIPKPASILQIPLLPTLEFKGRKTRVSHRIYSPDKITQKV